MSARTLSNDACRQNSQSALRAGQRTAPSPRVPIRELAPPPLLWIVSPVPQRNIGVRAGRHGLLGAPPSRPESVCIPGGYNRSRDSLQRMQPKGLLVQKVLVLVGFFVVAGGQLPLLNIPGSYAHDMNFYFVASALGFVLLGCAFWAWLTALSHTRVGRTEMRWVLRLVAVACLVLGVANAGFINEIIEIHRQPQHPGLRRQLLAYGLPLVGFCMAALGFWSSARSSEVRPEVTAREMEPTAL